MLLLFHLPHLSASHESLSSDQSHSDHSLSSNESSSNHSPSSDQSHSHSSLTHNQSSTHHNSSSHHSSSFFDSHFDHLSSSGDLSNSSGGSPLVRSTNSSSSRLIAHPGDSPSFVDSSALHSFELRPGLTTSAGSNDSANLAFLAFFAELVESISFSHGDASSSAEFTTLVLALDSHCLGFCSSTSSSFSGSSSSSCEELSSSDFKLFFEFSCVLELHSGGGSLCLGHN